MKRLVLLIAPLVMLAAPALAHDPPPNEGQKRIHAVYSQAGPCLEEGAQFVGGENCRSSFIRVFVTDMQGCYLAPGLVIADCDESAAKKMPAAYRIMWKPEGAKWPKHGRPNRKNRGSVDIPHIPKDFTIGSDPHSGTQPNIDISDKISLKNGKRLLVRVRPIYHGEKNGPWTKSSPPLAQAGTGWMRDYACLYKHIKSDVQCE